LLHSTNLHPGPSAKLDRLTFKPAFKSREGGLGSPSQIPFPLKGLVPALTPPVIRVFRWNLDNVRQPYCRSLLPPPTVPRTPSSQFTCSDQESSQLRSTSFRIATPSRPLLDWVDRRKTSKSVTSNTPALHLFFRQQSASLPEGKTSPNPPNDGGSDEGCSFNRPVKAKLRRP